MSKYVSKLNIEELAREIYSAYEEKDDNSEILQEDEILEILFEFQDQE